jgi:hypothetical protein
MDMTQPQQPFWTPFPTQSMPMQSSYYGDMTMDFASPVDSMNGMHWVYDNSNPPPPSNAAQHLAVTQAMMDATIVTMSPTHMAGSVPMTDWGWQQDRGYPHG